MPSFLDLCNSGVMRLRDDGDWAKIEKELDDFLANIVDSTEMAVFLPYSVPTAEQRKGKFDFLPEVMEEDLNSWYDNCCDPQVPIHLRVQSMFWYIEKLTMAFRYVLAESSPTPGVVWAKSANLANIMADRIAYLGRDDLKESMVKHMVAFEMPVY